MDDPDLKLDALSIWVRGRANPSAADYFDGNWLLVRAAVQVGQSSVITEGAILMVTDFERFRDQLTAMHETLTGEASLSGYEPNLKVTLRASRLGHIGGTVEITPAQMTEFHRFEFELDQTYLQYLVASCDDIIQSFPVVGRPEG